MDSIEINDCDSASHAAMCFFLVHTPKGRMWVRIVYAVILGYLLMAMGPYSWDIPSAIVVLKCLVLVLGLYLLWRCILLPFSAATGYSGPHHTHRTIGFDTTKKFRYTLNTTTQTLDVEEQSLDTDPSDSDANPTSASHPIRELRVIKKMGNI